MKFFYRSEAVADRTLSLVARLPDSFPLIHRDVRRGLLRRFPYALYYRRQDEGSIEVLACLHTRRSPHILRSRS